MKFVGIGLNLKMNIGMNVIWRKYFNITMKQCILYTLFNIKFVIQIKNLKKLLGNLLKKQ